MSSKENITTIPTAGFPSGKTKSLLMATTVLMLAAPTFAAAATATAAPPAAPSSTDSTSIAPVIVTARKRSEDVLKVPEAITAVTGAAIQQRGIQTLNDLANYTPGVADDQSAIGTARADRSFQSIIIRGMNPSLITTNPTTSIFINGTPIPSSDMLQGLSDVDHVEILKGPQSAYFGRETFAGAVNVISKSASNYLSGDFDGEIGTRNTYIFSGNVSGPIIPDRLLVTVGAKYDSHDGSYRNAFNRSQTLGDQSTRSWHIGVTANPFENLTIKAYALWIQDRDGPSATGLYLANAGPFSQSNCTIAATPFFCGTLPSLNYAVSPAQNTTITPALAAFLQDPGGILKHGSTVNGFGLKRDASHADLNIQYAAPRFGLTFTNLMAYNQDDFSELSDLSNIDSAPGGQYPGYVGIPGFQGFPYMVQQAHFNWSEEFRVATDADKPFRALVGLSYLDNHDDQAIGISKASLNATPTEARTAGIFFSFAYDILPQLTVNFDGRYQRDQEYAYSSNRSVLAQGTFYSFLPRVSVQYRFTPDVMAYFTYSQGVNPGTFNTQYANLPAVSKAEIAANGYKVGISTQPEELTNYEIGIKGRFLDGRATLAADIYYDEWTNQLNGVSYVFQANDPANPINVPGSSSYNPNLPSADPIPFTSNNAASNPKGFELEGELIPVDHVTLNLALAYNNTKYTSFICYSCKPYPTYDAKGKYLPNAPLFSTTFGAMYANSVDLFGGSHDWFGRVDVIYRDGVWLDSSNTVKTPASTLVNLRGGITLGKGFSLEGFIDNVTNEKAPVSGFQAFNFATFFTNTAIDVGLPQLITGGVELRYKYY